MNFDLPDFFATYSQRRGRIIRLGSTHKDVFLYNCLTSGGIDESTFHKLMKQKDVIDLVVEKTDEEEAAVILATKLQAELLEDLFKK